MKHNTIGEKIRTYREYKGLKQTELAELCGINVGTIRKYELGLRNPKVDQLEKIACALGLNVSVFLDLKILTIRDVMSLLFLIDEAVDLSLSSVSTNNDGTETISFTFENAHLQDYITKWCEVKNSYDKKMEEIYNHNTDNMKQVEFHSLEKKYDRWKLWAMSNGFSASSVVMKGIKGTKGITPKLPDLE